MSDQTTFAAALLDPERPCPPGLSTWNGSNPARRFAVYRNNVLVSLIDALADSFPVTQQLVGEEFFRAMARIYAGAHPPTSAIMATYGTDFPDFVAAFPPAAGLPYLADVARLEMLRVAAYHAADMAPLSAARIGEMLADEVALPGCRVSLHPSLGILRSPHAVVSLWAAHQGLGELASVVPERAEAALVLRVGLEVEISEISPATAVFLGALQAGQALGAALEATAAVDGVFDLISILARLIQNGAITALDA